MVSWKAKANTSNGITAEEYEKRMDWVESIFNFAKEHVFINTTGIQCKINHSSESGPVVISLSEEPYFSLFFREMRTKFEQTKESTAEILFTYIKQ